RTRRRGRRAGREPPLSRARRRGTRCARVATARRLDIADVRPGRFGTRRPGRRPPGEATPAPGGSYRMTTRRPVFAVAALAALAAASAAPAAAQDEEPLTVKAVYSSVIEEPWDGVIHAALEEEAAAGRIIHTFQDDIGYSGDMEFVLRDIAEGEKPDIIF